MTGDNLMPTRRTSRPILHRLQDARNQSSFVALEPVILLGFRRGAGTAFSPPRLIHQRRSSDRTNTPASKSQMKPGRWSETMNLRNSLILMSAAAAIAAFTASPTLAQTPKNGPAGVNGGKSDPAAPTYLMKKQRGVSGQATGGGDSAGPGPGAGTSGSGSSSAGDNGGSSGPGGAGGAGAGAGAGGAGGAGGGGAGGGGSQ
jgi:hypothetical protein